MWPYIPFSEMDWLSWVLFGFQSLLFVGVVGFMVLTATAAVFIAKANADRRDAPEGTDNQDEG